MQSTTAEFAVAQFENDPSYTEIDEQEFEYLRDEIIEISNNEQNKIF